MIFRPWSQREDMILRERYISEGPEAIARETHRSASAVCHRARRLGIQRVRPWSERDDSELQDTWGELALKLISKRLGRTTLACYWRAGQLGLPRGCPQGHEYLSHAAKRTGYQTSQLRKILRWAHVYIGVTPSRPHRPTPGFRFHHVDPFDVDDAVRAWLQTEPVERIAARHDLDNATARRILMAARQSGNLNVSEPPGRSKAHWRVKTSTGEALIAAYLGLESVRAGALRTGVNRTKLLGWLLAAGIPKPPGRFWRLEPKTIDRVVAENHRRPSKRAA